MHSNLTRYLIIVCVALMLGACASDKKKKEDHRSAQEIYQSAKHAMELNNYQLAISYYKNLLNKYPFGRHTEQAHLELAYSYFKNGEPDLAITTLNRFIKTYPTHPNIDYAHYLKGLVNFSRNASLLDRFVDQEKSDRDLEFAREAFLEFAELLREYPESRYEEDARKRMVHLRNQLARHELAVADYYYRRSAYIASANRAKFIVEHYPETPEVASALVMMVKCYRALDLSQPADDSMRVLKLNFPEHPFVQGVELPDDEGFMERLWPDGIDLWPFGDDEDSET